MEEKRIFWVAYCLDPFVSICNGWPLTLNEEVVSEALAGISSWRPHSADAAHQICTRLLVPEVEFQSSQPLQLCFLSGAMASSD
jgi:hypothetical protein